MAFLLAPIPRWVFNDNQGKPLIGGTMQTFRADDPTVEKAVYADAGGTLAYLQPITFSSDGGAGPFYWEDDVPYFVVVKDFAGNTIFTINNFTPPGSGGGPPVTNNVDVENHIINHQFRNFGELPSTPVTANEYIEIAPAGWNFFTEAVANDTVISYERFALGTEPPANTPTFYLNINETLNTPGNGRKDIAYVIPDVNSFQDDTISFAFWANAGSNTPVQVYWRQEFGDGAGASNFVETPLGSPITVIAGSWTRYIINNFTLPSVVTKNVDGIDQAVLIIRLPATTPVSNFQTVNWQLQRSQAITDDIYKTTLQTDVETFPFTDNTQTGTIRDTLNVIAPTGWVFANGTSIGNSSSTASGFASNTTEELFTLLWDNYPNLKAGVLPGGPGASAAADFAANKTIPLPDLQGRITPMQAPIATPGVINFHDLGETTGADEHQLTIAEMPTHNHPPPNASRPFIVGQAAAGTQSPGGGFDTTAAATGNRGGDQPHNNIQPSFYVNKIIKL